MPLALPGTGGYCAFMGPSGSLPGIWSPRPNYRLGRVLDLELMELSGLETFLHYRWAANAYLPRSLAYSQHG